MGKRGPQPTPTSLLKLTGSRKAEERVRAGEPEPEACIPDAPPWLAPEALEHYERMATALGAVKGLLTAVDGENLAMAAEALLDYLNARKMVENEGSKLDSESGNVYANPSVAMKNNAWTRFKQATAAFGMTPADRTKISLAPPEQSLSPMQQLMAGKRGA